MKVESIDEALKIVREKHPSATREGSTFDWSFWVDGKVVAVATLRRRSLKMVYDLKIYDVPIVQ